MKNIWTKIRTEINKISPEIAESLAKPASEKALNELQESFSIPLPKSILDYFRCFNGQNHENYQIPFIGGNCLVSAEESLKIIKTQCELFGDEPDVDICENKIKPKIWDRAWLPIADYMGGGKIIIDFNPGKNGVYGQVCQLWPGQDLEEDELVLADSFEEFSQELLSRLQKNECYLEDGLICFEDDWVV